MGALRGRGRGARGRARVVAVAVALVATGCDTSGASVGGFANRAAVLACAETVVWGTVADSEQVADGLAVTVDVQEWVHPADGGATLESVADDPAQQVGAPAWDTAGGRVLVILARDAPPSRTAAAEGAQAVAEWREAGSPRRPRAECERA